MKLFNKILIANRGEIAVRIIRTLRKMGIPSVVVFSSRDKNAFHVSLADEAFDLGGNELSETYLDIEKIINIASQSGVDGIHPGYGFLSENAAFAKAVSESGINFIGPTHELIELMGDKIAARKTMREIDIPMINGIEGSVNEIFSRSNELKFPLLIKAAAGGGGKAMRIAEDAASLKENLEIASREAGNYFGNNVLYAEQYIKNARHIEVQLLADHYGNNLILGERECSVQRRYQKVLEESPAVSLSEGTRDSIYRSAYKIAKKIAYNNAGTLEFLVDPNGNHYFLEMNTRIQVEHPVTEMVTGLDIVELQIQIAAGNQLSLKQKDIRISGHAIEARLYAEDPGKNFMPSPGKVELYHEPVMPGLRVDSGINGKEKLHPEYDPLISKVIFHAQSREEAIDGLNSALKTFIIHGPKNNKEFLNEILADTDFRHNRISTTYLESATSRLNIELNRKKTEFDKVRIFSAWLAWKLFSPVNKEDNSIWTKIGFWRMDIRKSVIFEEKQFDIQVGNIKGQWISYSINGIEHELAVKTLSGQKVIFELDGEWSSASVSRAYSYEDIISIDGLEFKIRPLDYLPIQPYLIDHQEIGETGTRVLKSPLFGKISKIIAEPGMKIKKGDFLYSLDAMKIENKFTSPYNGHIKEIKVKEGEQVQINQTVLVIDT